MLLENFEELRKRAARWRGLAIGMTDKMAVEALVVTANELEQRALRIEDERSGAKY